MPGLIYAAFRGFSYDANIRPNFLVELGRLANGAALWVFGRYARPRGREGSDKR